MAQLCSRVQSPPASPTSSGTSERTEPKASAPRASAPPAKGLTTHIPRVTLNHRYLPHIIDIIFDVADPSAQIKMSQVCRSWRHRVLRRYYHLFNPTGNDEEVTFRHSSDGGQQTLRWPEHQLLLACRVVDITNSGCALDYTWVTTMTDTIRFTNPSSFCCSPPLPRVPFKRLICQNFWPPIVTSQWANITNLIVIYGDDFRTSPANKLMALPHVLPSLRSIVIICRERPNEQRTAQEKEFWMELNGALELWRARAPSRYPRVYIVSANGDRPALPLLMFPTVAWSLDQYKRIIGEKEYDIETEFDKVLAP